MTIAITVTNLYCSVVTSRVSQNAYAKELKVLLEGITFIKQFVTSDWRGVKG